MVIPIKLVSKRSSVARDWLVGGLPVLTYLSLHLNFKNFKIIINLDIGNFDYLYKLFF